MSGDGSACSGMSLFLQVLKTGRLGDEREEGETIGLMTRVYGRGRLIPTPVLGVDWMASALLRAHLHTVPWFDRIDVNRLSHVRSRQ